MVMGSSISDGLRFGDYFQNQMGVNSYIYDGLGRGFNDDLGHSLPVYSHSQTVEPYVAPYPQVLTTIVDDSHQHPEIYSDIALGYINKILMEEDVNELNVGIDKPDPALLAAEKHFLEVLTYSPTSPDGPPKSSESLGSSEDSNGGIANHGVSHVFDDHWPSDVFCELHSSLELRSLRLHYSPQLPFSSNDSSSHGIGGNNILGHNQLLIGSQRILECQFRRGIEEANRFLPYPNKLVIDLESTEFFQQPAVEPRDNSSEFMGVKLEEEQEGSLWSSGSKGRKILHDEEIESESGRRSTKQSAFVSEEAVRSSMFDEVLLCNCGKKTDAVTSLMDALRTQLSKNSKSDGNSKNSGGKSRGKRQPKKEVVDLRTQLIHCAQSVAADDRRSANELLKQIRLHSSPSGDASQRLAQIFANGLEARLAGTGSDCYHSFMVKRKSASAILKAYHLYIAACPFQRIAHFFANQTILNVAENATKLHIIDFGILFGFQWPCLIQRLSSRHNGPPKLRITGIDIPEPGFRPTARLEETGRRLLDYCQSFGVPFEYHHIATKWEDIRVEDLNIDKDEVVVINCLYRFRHLADEMSMAAVDSPRSIVLRNIRKMNPNIFIHGIVNGSYSAPFFVTRFREALFHYSSLFDMLDTTVPREQPERLLIETELFGREAMNVVACEGSERVERPETYKQWQVRNTRAGFRQLPLNREIMNKCIDRVRTNYHKDFLVDEDSKWLLQGWKGRIIFCLSTWKSDEKGIM